LQWLYQAQKRYGLSILNYMVTSNHVHLRVVHTGKREVIPKSMQLVAGRTGQEYNQRKNRRRAYWEDRYHTNMVRAGVVSHPSMWRFSGYSEIQEPRRKNILIDDARLQGLFGAGTYAELTTSHRGWIEEYLGEARKGRQGEWTDSIAVGSRAFAEKVKSLLGFKAKGRETIKREDGYHLREEAAPYMVLLDTENGDIGPENAYSWDIKTE
jgi:putative transposase